MALGLSFLTRKLFRGSTVEADLVASHVPHDDDLHDAPLTREEKFVMEALEPRILLSADPFTGEFSRIADDALNGDPTENAAIVAVLETVSETAASASDKALELDDPAVSWPSDWTSGARELDGVEGDGNSPETAGDEAENGVDTPVQTVAVLAPLAASETGGVDLAEALKSMLDSLLSRLEAGPGPLMINFTMADPAENGEKPLENNGRFWRLVCHF